MTSMQMPEDRRIRVRLGDLGLAPENLRFDEPADAGVPRLADTIGAAGMIYPPVVRKGRKGEQPFMVLDGRRRRFALLLRVERGDATLDDEIECLLAPDKAAQAAAAVLTNSEHAPIHTADVIVAIGKLRKARMTTAAIAAALGYDELEIRRLEALASVHPDVLLAFRRAKLTLRQVRLFARLKDKDRQAQLAGTALDGYFHEYQIEDLVRGGRVTVEDDRFRLVGRERYADAGGRLESDLFGEMPDGVLDEPVLARLWRERAEGLSAGLAEKELTVHLGEDGGYRAPDGLYTPPYVNVHGLPEPARTAFDAARARVEAAYERIVASETPADADIADWLMAQLEAARAKCLEGSIEAVLLSPGEVTGLDPRFFWRPPQVVPDEAAANGEGDEDDEDDAAFVGAPETPEPEPEPEPVGVSHALHELRTDLATRGLMRSLVDDPTTALIALTAQLFKQVVLRGPDTRETAALAISAQRYEAPGFKPVDGLDVEVRRRLDLRREAYAATGEKPIAFVAALAPDERLALLAEMVAVTLDLREGRTYGVRRGARAEAQAIAELCQAELTAHWTPDVRFLEGHTKPLLAGMVADMGIDDPRAGGLKKDELVAFVAQAAAERRWAPDSVQWRAPAAAGEAAAEATAGGEAAGDAPDAASAESAASAHAASASEEPIDAAPDALTPDGPTPATAAGAQAAADGREAEPRAA